MADEKNPKNEDEKPLSDLSSGGRGFYSGFDKPDPMKVNLAGAHEDFVAAAKPIGTIDHPTMITEEREPEPMSKPVEPKPMAPMPETIETPKPVETAPVKPPKPAKPPVVINWRAVMFIFVGGILGAGIFGAASYFGSGYYYHNKLDAKQTDLNNLETQKQSLEVVPKALEPTVQEVPESSAPTPAVTPTPAPQEEEPIQQEPTTPTTGQGNG